MRSVSKVRWVSALLFWVVVGLAAANGRLAAAAEPREYSSNDGEDGSDVERQALLDSDEWHDTMHALDEWFSAQPIYSEEQVERIKVRMRRSIARMSHQELMGFKQDLDEKLDILFSPEWRGTMEWLSEKLAVATKSYAKKIGLRYPDVANMSAAQLQKQLDSLQAQQAGAQREATAFSQIRRERVATAEREVQEQNRSRVHALDRASAHIGAGAYHSSYHPSRARQNPPYLRQSGRIGFGYGFGFW
jgi:hypothetical protein